jgi:hypothetical protein
MNKPKYYKLTDQNDQTYKGTQWGPGVTHSLPPVPEPYLCASDVIHFYTSPNLAYLMSPIHTNYDNPHLWLVDIDKIEVTNGLKCGTFKLTTIKRLPKPDWVDSKYDKPVRVQFAVLCAEAVLPMMSGPKDAIQAAEAWLAEPSKENARAARFIGDATEVITWVARAAGEGAGVVVAAAMTALRAADYINIDFGELADQAVGMIVKKK